MEKKPEVRHIEQIAGQLQIAVKQATATITLLQEGSSVPFIARYRKEVTGSLDEVQITAVRDRYSQLIELEKRREAILKSLDERDLLNDELREKIMTAETMTVLEDIYLPYRPKRRTRATIAREKGLEPLAELLFKQTACIPTEEAAVYIYLEKGVDTVETALAGARDIIAEWINEDEIARRDMRKLFERQATFKSKVLPGKEEEGVKYKDYFASEEPVGKAKSHRILAMRRGEKELILSLRVLPPEEDAHKLLDKLFLKTDNEASEQVRMAIRDSYKRLLAPALETELRTATKIRADEEAIAVFADNLRQVLLSPPLGQKNVLAIDPGFRTGCKMVCLNRQGKLLHHETIYPFQSDSAKEKAAQIIIHCCKQFHVEVIAIGNGTAGRETESFARGIQIPGNIFVVMVNESGASVYSASKIAREEFPDHDVTIRGAVSIGRRLMDPLAELVKIDPKSIGVGQYQHDVDQVMLRQSLDDVVSTCVNSVGVEANTASKQLLTYVSGFGPKLAQNIVEYRNSNGPFPSREALKKITGLGPKAFEQAAGFLRIRDGENPLDTSAVHPESYPVVLRMTHDCNCTIQDLLDSESIRNMIDVKKYITETVGLPTLNDIMEELKKPGRDPRQQFEVFSFADGVESIEDLRTGMKLPGIVTNVTKFGAFVDIGVHQDGLVHISQLADRFVKDPFNVVKVNQKVMVTVLEIDPERKRISLSMKKEAFSTQTG